MAKDMVFAPITIVRIKSYIMMQSTTEDVNRYFSLVFMVSSMLFIYIISKPYFVLCKK